MSCSCVFKMMLFMVFKIRLENNIKVKDTYPTVSLEKGEGDNHAVI